jgi:hypothetical protein
MSQSPAVESVRKLQGFCTKSSRSDGVHRIGRKYSPMFRRALIPLMAVLLAAGGMTAPADAQRGQRDNPFNQWDQPRDERMPQRDVSLSDVLRDLRRKYGGQHLDARKVGDHYIIAWMTEDGRRLNIRVNAANGREE